TPAKSPLLKKSIHFAFTASISVFWANAGKISPTTKAIASAIVRMTHDSCDVRFAPYALATRPILPSALRWQNDTEYNALVRTHLSRSADVSATIGRDHVIDLVVGYRRPNTVHFNFVVIANDATLGRPTIHQIAAQTSVVSSELRVEALMPFIVARPVVSLLRRGIHTKKQGSRAAEKRYELAAPHSITSSARAISIGGSSRPSALAVRRLTRSSSLVGCSTGRSPGEAPLKILSISPAALKYRRGTPPAVEERACANEECSSPHSQNAFKCGVDVAFTASLQKNNLPPEIPGCGLYLCYYGLSGRKVRVHEMGDHLG